MLQGIHRIIRIKPSYDGIIVAGLHVAQAQIFVEFVTGVAYVVQLAFYATTKGLVVLFAGRFFEVAVFGDEFFAKVEVVGGAQLAIGERCFTVQ